MAKTPVAEQVQVNFRMPVDLRDRIKAAADENSRSMNAEIILRLEQTFKDDHIEEMSAAHLDGRPEEMRLLVANLISGMAKSLKHGGTLEELVERLNANSQNPKD